jgi:hypothetical protein
MATTGAIRSVFVVSLPFDLVNKTQRIYLIYFVTDHTTKRRAETRKGARSPVAPWPQRLPSRVPLVEGSQGGRSGGGARLTPAGAEVLAGALSDAGSACSRGVRQGSLCARPHRAIVLSGALIQRRVYGRVLPAI